jgi:hypothetical protein
MYEKLYLHPSSYVIELLCSSFLRRNIHDRMVFVHIISVRKSDVGNSEKLYGWNLTTCRLSSSVPITFKHFSSLYSSDEQRSVQIYWIFYDKYLFFIYLFFIYLFGSR